jgi:hypothetical protein
MAGASANASRLASAWTAEDSKSESLKQAIPEHFVRDLVIKDTNRDLAQSAHPSFAASVDSLHAEVVAQRFRDPDSQLAARGYGVPILFPDAGDLPWDTIADLRASKGMTRFREIMREVESETTAEAMGGDVEAAVHHAYEKHFAEAVGHIDGLAASFRRTGVGFVIGVGAGLLTSGITGPLGLIAGTAIGSAQGAVVDMRNVVRTRRSRGWVAVARRLVSAS